MIVTAILSLFIGFGFAVAACLLVGSLVGDTVPLSTVGVVTLILATFFGVFVL